MVLEKPLESPLDYKEIKSVFGRTVSEAETQILHPANEKRDLIGKDPDVGKGEGDGRGCDG